MSSVIDVLSARERSKLRYLIDTCTTVYDAWGYHKIEDEDHSFAEKADKAGWWFDWELVVRECAPELLVVLSGDRRSETRIPTYVVVPSAHEWFELVFERSWMEGLLRVAVPEDRGIGDFTQSLDVLRKMITDGPSDRRGEAMKHLNALARIIKPTL